MSTFGCKDEVQAHGHEHAGHSAEHPASCLPCEACRNNYYTGKLLTARDFQMEQDYFRGKHRLHNLSLHGWGVVCGLEITPHPNKECRRFVLHPGIAIDACGREVRVLHPRDFDLPKPPKKPKKAPCPDDEMPPSSKPPDDQTGQEPPASSEYSTAHPHDRETIDLYICLAYRECPEEYAPAPFDECNCNGPSQKPSRICEEYALNVYQVKPDWWDKVMPEDCCDADCTTLWKEGRKCHFPLPVPCIPIAVIRDYLPGDDLDAESIVDIGAKLLLPGTALLKRAIDCILHKLPLKDYTVIEGFNWTHGRDYMCQDFLRLFVGEHESIEARFSRPLDPDGVSIRTFQLMVVYRDRPSEPRHMHIAPMEVKLSHDRRTVHLHIDREYAKAHLDRHHFDLYIKVYCDKLLDESGNPVDGNLLAKRMPDDRYMVSPPTGNGAPGGIFDSWILIR